MSSQSGGGRPARRRSDPRSDQRRGASGARSRGNQGSAGTKRQRVSRARSLEEADGNVRYSPRRERNFELPRSVVDELRDIVDGPQAVALERRLTQAAQAYDRDRYKEALTVIKPVVDAAPDAPAVMELYGLILYRLGRWRHAAKVLRRVSEETGSLDQLPVVADCERALGRLDQVRELWDRMRREGVDREVLVEGRLVMAGALADAGELEEAIALLRPAAQPRKHADVPVLREWYALADLYESAGELPRARELFARVAAQAPDLLDAPARLRAIR
jgi:tetratricopeptide (TPR) repeat protein